MKRTRLIPLFAIPFAVQSLVACSGDDASGPTTDAGGAMDAGSDGATDATSASDGGTTDSASDSGTESDGATDGGDAGDGGPLAKINHVVVIYLENHSFDNLFGSWPGADGIADGGASVAQVGPNGTPYTTLPQYGPSPSVVESLADASIDNGAFDLTGYFQENAFINDLLHRFYQEQQQINGGRMDSYVLWNDESAGQSMGVWPTASLPVSQWMQGHSQYVTLCDHFFHAAFGGSFLNHFWLIAAQSPSYPNAPTDAGLIASPSDGGVLEGVLDTTTIPPSLVYDTGANDGQLTPDGFVVNTSYSVNEPHPTKYDQPGAKTNQLVPQQTFATIGDRLDGAGVTWAWYAGGWNAALEAGGVSSVGTDAGSDIPDTGAIPAAIGAYAFEYHHQPFVYFENWGGTANNGGVGTQPPNGKWATNHNLQDENDFIAAAAAGTLPSVSFVKPLYDEHSNYTTETDSQNHTVELLDDLIASPNWNDTVVIITYDENGGFADHVAPPTTDKWGPGSRVPGIVISPFAKGGVDSTTYDTTAILKLIEDRWSLQALSTRDAAQASLATHALSLP
jgi:acid phosphatase